MTAHLADGGRIALEKTAVNIAWEHNENELAVRLNLTIQDVCLSDGVRLSKKLALCTVIGLHAVIEGNEYEIFRGTIWAWSHEQTHDEQIVITCYDRLYALQKSQDNRFFAKQTGTKTVISKILTSQGLTMGDYTASDVKHGKLLFKNMTAAAMITDTLKDADEKSEKKAGENAGVKSALRMRNDCVDVIARGENATVYAFIAGQNIMKSLDHYSMTDLVTRVVITGKENKNKLPKVVATVNGRTEYGIFQQLHARGSTTLKAAKEAAQKILDERGKPKRKTSITAPEFPILQKGDKIYVATDEMSGHFFVAGVSHSATSGQMQMEVEPCDE